MLGFDPNDFKVEGHVRAGRNVVSEQVEMCCIRAGGNVVSEYLHVLACPRQDLDPKPVGSGVFAWIRIRIWFPYFSGF